MYFQDQAEFTYDSEYNWFKIICPSSQEDSIRLNFGVISRDFEEKAFDEYEDDMLEYNDILKVLSFGPNVETLGLRSHLAGIF